MKKATLLVLILLSGTFSLFAQNKPETPAFGFTFGVQGLQNLQVVTNPTVGFRYWMANGITGRLNLNVTMNNHTTESTVLGIKQTITDKNTNFGVAIGAQKNFEGTDNLNPYVGIDLNVGTAGGGTHTDRSEIKDSTGFGDLGFANGDFYEVKTTFAKGISFGLTPFIGFDYFFVPNLALGAEFGWGVSTASLKNGKQEITARYTDGGGTATSTTINTEPNATDKNFGLGTHGSATIKMSVYF